MRIQSSIEQIACGLVSNRILRLFSQTAEWEEVVKLSDTRSGGLSHVAGAWDGTSKQRTSVIQAV